MEHLPKHPRIFVHIDSLEAAVYMNTPSFKVRNLQKLIKRIEKAIRKDQEDR